ncbi:MAG: caspase family protein [Alphaproteobacteria bacterium]|nr:caspase family protein [Alphaproteobacteria bacterium]
MIASNAAIREDVSIDEPGWSFVWHPKAGEQRRFFSEGQLSGKGVVVGRASHCDIPIDDPSLSRQHCRIQFSNGRLMVSDAGSTNGVFVAGRRLGPDESDTLDPGDSLRLGSVVVGFERVVPQPVVPDDGTMLSEYDENGYNAEHAMAEIVAGVMDRSFSFSSAPQLGVPSNGNGGGASVGFSGGGASVGGSATGGDAQLAAPINFRLAADNAVSPQAGFAPPAGQGAGGFSAPPANSAWGNPFPVPPAPPVPGLPPSAAFSFAQPQSVPVPRKRGRFLIAATVLVSLGLGGAFLMKRYDMGGAELMALVTPESASTEAPAAAPAPVAAAAPAPVAAAAAPARPVVVADARSSNEVTIHGKRGINKVVETKYRGVDFGNYHALVIGNNNYQYVPKLDNATLDANAVADALANEYGFDVTKILDGNRSDILSAIDRLRGSLTEKDNLLIFYAGHGYLDKLSDRGYWLPVDAQADRRANWISNADITDALKAIQAKHVLIVADSCYSGTLTRATGMSVPTPLLRINGFRSRNVMASGGIEPVADGGGKNKHSIFTSAFLDALKKNTEVVDGQNLFNMVRDPVRLNTDQMPEYNDIRNTNHEVGGDFIFVRR